ncbi:rod shape-determining protein MreC [Hymenobacter ginsengisoli]|uniref:Cell shape-determining protein MreC n=1 Tax=Hymenobacter ginsengisoli TaxID=1051626 RepID=A0ABP8Q980_9BACT|nr:MULTISPECIES: rod shape-determining protein MreC [unclassified Hymenobacter]MBO2031619.1 rod shape-determining protein MreC [Hymenobacter sp. BT559]
MRNLIAFLLRFQGVMLFVLLEVVSLFLFITNSSYQRAAFFNSANAYAGAVLARRTQIADYFRLDELNRQLLADNAKLRQQLYPPDFSRREADSLPVGRDTLGHLIYRHLRPDPSQALAAATAPGLGQNAKPKKPNALARPDTLLLGGAKLATHDADYPLVAARVLNNSLRAVDNYLTLNVGTADGVQPGLGVLSAAGVVGQVKSASAHYATVFSLLHSKMAIAAKIKRDGTFGSVKWPGEDYSHALLDYIPRQNRLVRGDSVVTSGYNAVFPEGVFIGTVESFVKEPDKNFWTVHLRLGVDFSRLTYVYVVHNRPRTERDSLETALTAPEPAPVKPAKQPTRPTR